MPGISAARAQKLEVELFKSKTPTSGIYARDFRGVRARVREKLEVETNAAVPELKRYFFFFYFERKLNAPVGPCYAQVITVTLNCSSWTLLCTVLLRLN